MLPNWLSLVLLVLPITGAVLYRIKVEEAALVQAFGEDYKRYQRSTKRLLPIIY